MLKFACDGCGLAIDKPHSRGSVRQSHYCDTCVPAIDAFLIARSELHTEITTLFKDKLDALKTEFNSKIPNGKLPDE